MRFKTEISALALLALLGGCQVEPSADAAFEPHNPANTIRLEADHPDSFTRFSPELPAMLARAPRPNTESGLHVSEIEPGLFFVTDMVYQSAFLVTEEGVVLFDAPPSFAERLRPVVEETAAGAPITHLIMSHGHSDHNAGGFAFADIDGLTVIAADAVAETLAAQPLRGVLTPTQTFQGQLDLEIGGVPISLVTTRFHAEDEDVMIYLPEQRFLMAIDTITPGEAPFMNFGATTDVNAYFGMFDTFLAYEFDHFLSGHVSALGTREDVETARDYAHDVRDRVITGMANFQDRFMGSFETLEYRNANLAYRQAMETVRDECAAGIIDSWGERLSAVDIWAPSHCNYTVLYYIMH